MCLHDPANTWQRSAVTSEIEKRVDSADNKHPDDFARLACSVEYVRCFCEPSYCIHAKEAFSATAGRSAVVLFSVIREEEVTVNLISTMLRSRIKARQLQALSAGPSANSLRQRIGTVDPRRR
jgi:hypothetical protein